VPDSAHETIYRAALRSAGSEPDEHRALLARMQARASLPDVGKPSPGVVAAAQSAIDRLSGRKTWSEPATTSWIPTMDAVGPAVPPSSGRRAVASAPTPEVDYGPLLARLDEMSTEFRVVVAETQSRWQVEEERRRRLKRRARILGTAKAMVKAAAAAIGWLVAVAVGLNQLGVI
jgi:hypothetical protein